MSVLHNLCKALHSTFIDYIAPNQWLDMNKITFGWAEFPHQTEI